MKIRIKEDRQTPQAIFMAGPAGAGKSFVSKSLPLSKFQVINVDDTFEELLKAAGIGMKQKDFSPEELSQAAKLMGQAQKSTKEKYAKALENLNDIIIDGTGAASKPLLKKKAELEALGYETMMIMIWVSPITSLERNKNRERSLTPGIVLTTWNNINKNIGIYQQEFGDNFPEISFKDFFTEMNKIFNITWWIERVGSINYIRIEKEEDARSLNKIDLTIKNIDELESKINEEILYGSVSVGGREYQDFPYLSLRNDQLTYVGFKNETFQVKGQCNLDKVLDLKSSYIFDHNIIENCLINGSSTSFEFDFIKDIFVISCKLISGTYVAEMTSWVYGSLSNTTNLYNEQLTNIKIILRWNNILNQSYIGIGGTTTNGAKVYAFSADVNIIGRWGNGGNDTVRVQFEYDTIYGFDLSNNYGNGTSTPVSQPNSIYTAPIQDFYRHIVIFEWIILGKNSLQSQAAPITVKLRIFDSTSFNYNTITINRTYTGYPDYHWIANDIFDFGFVKIGRAHV